MLSLSVVTKKAAKIVFESSGPAQLEMLDQVHELVRQINLFYSGLGILSEDSIVNRSLYLTKGEPSDVEIAAAFLYFRMREAASGSLKFWDVEGLANKYSDKFRHWWQEIESDRRDFRCRLDELFNNRRQALERHQNADIQLLRDQATIIPWLGNNGEVAIRYFPASVEAGYTIALTLLYQKDFERLNRLRTCAWEPCSAYFLRKVSEKGGRPQLYCTSVCQKKPDGKGSLARQATSEQRKKQRERRRKYREEGKK